MKPMNRYYIADDNGEKVFGEGPYRLLKAVEEEGSLRAAAISMGMAYTKALKILRRAEEAFGQNLTSRCIGGSNGGGSRVTPFGKELLNLYEQYRDACEAATGELFARFFPDD